MLIRVILTTRITSKGFLLVRLFSSRAFWFCGLVLSTSLLCFSAPPTQRPTRPSALITPKVQSGHREGSSELAGRRVKAAPASAHSGTKLSTDKGQLISVQELARQLRLDLQALEGGRRFIMSGLSMRLEFEADSRECFLNGQRVFLGEALRYRKGVPSFSLIDAQRLITPAARPGWHAPTVPRLRTIVIDPGHGGVDSGKTNRTLRVNEKTFTLDTAFRLQRLLQAKGYKVVLTRKDDSSVELARRPLIARMAKGDLFISIHFNSVASKAEQVTGVEVFTLTPQWQLSADQRPDPVYSPVKNPGNEYDYWNAMIGSALHRQMIEQLKVPDRGLKRSRFAVLRLAPCPAVLVEAGYLSNNTEAALVAKAHYRQKIAEAIASGVADYDRGLTVAQRKLGL